MHILIAEDEPQLNAMLAKRLREEGYVVDSCLSGTEAMDYLACSEYDAAILDIMMPGADGYQVLRYLRSKETRPTPVLFLTALDGVQERVAGLDAGADDYLVKPFAFEELLARLRVVMRRNSGLVSNVLQVADLVMDLDTRQVSRAGQEVELSAKEYAILECLMRNKGAVLTREKIGSSVWGYDYMGGSNIVDVYVRYLRRKLDEPFETKLIQTVRGVGYSIREPR
ncbi:MAG: response regulator transcription factor [Coriobacteriaceae bacterium]|nr:response regulator transcription factor [Coriobacteriaceae bacterium]MDD6769243.1 response regulator transcription factor [Coriobacteriaceae bacterium]